MNDFSSYLNRGESLSEDEMRTAMSLIMEGLADEKDMEAFLLELASRGESVDEITGAARALRERAVTIKAPEDAVDCCGTGGDMSGSYNISTATALVAAACGVSVAKHGNRASSSKSGTADVLEALGVNLSLPREKLEEALRRFHFAFLMAPRHHRAMGHVRAVRKKIGRRTIFNLLGPLANPAGARLQLVGVYDKKLLRPMAGALKKLGARRAWLACGADGMDEITLTGPTCIATLDENGAIEEFTLAPADFGLPVYQPAAFKGGDAAENARALQALLEGEEGAYRDIVLANAAAVLCIHGTAADLNGGVKKARRAIDEGRAMKILEGYRAFSQGRGA